MVYASQVKVIHIKILRIFVLFLEHFENLNCTYFDFFLADFFSLLVYSIHLHGTARQQKLL